MTVDGRLSRRDFLRLRTTERGKLLEVSCRALFMRCADATIVHEDVVGWEPWMGEPPPVIHRRSADDLLDAFEQDLRDVAEFYVRLAERARNSGKGKETHSIDEQGMPTDRF